MPHFKLIEQLERDIRNQVVIDQMKRLDWKQKLWVYVNRHPIELAFAVAAIFWCTMIRIAFL